MKRRFFLRSCGAGAVLLAGGLSHELQAAIRRNPDKIKPIEGSWFEFQHHNMAEGKYWDATLKSFTAKQWEMKVKETADCGIRYLVLLDVAINGKTFYPSSLQPQHEMGCDDPLETILSAADKYGVDFFISNDYFGDYKNPYFLMTDPEINKLRLKGMNEIAEKYAHHKSFYGWYYPNETGITGYYDDFFIDYVNASSAEAAKLTPKAKTLIAPYGTRNVKADDQFTRQLEKLNVDFIAYQDEIGVEKTQVEESAGYFEQLYRVHKKASRARLWADVEIFRFEGEIYQSALLPAPAERIVRQLEAVSPFVEKILVYQYPGLLNKPGSQVFAGHPDSEILYKELYKHKVLNNK
ncbi:MAG: DUF4434 domain-containing protein [Proteiniphilum sp.]|jgi:hypothetical protein|uniref:DUF4434 domain-containing protein n=1 Tax=Proteiniphilum sp. TaxID=1926877 RepID=UPI000927E829|nr:DUF4434 domain-containing protein [Proteiniphilum sp.]MEA5129165.1 DUF4434 domain-containing protein [Proteiniphilum sp.]OJV86033.1 MAG: DUF4434 domain-containing protein [Bacteroidia bacterium 44-10]